jgi:hypothetical protein
MAKANRTTSKARATLMRLLVADLGIVNDLERAAWQIVVVQKAGAQ